MNKFGIRNVITRAESPTINSVGQRAMKLYVYTITSPERA